MTSNTPQRDSTQQFISKDDVKREANGRWLEVLQAAGLPYELLDGRGHPCPKCGGSDRFAVFGDVDLTGGAMCRQCFSDKNGDGLAVVQWLRGCSFLEAIAFVADELGLQVVPTTVESSASDIIAAVACAKRMPVAAFMQFGAKSAKRGKLTVARVPVWDERGEVHSYFDLTPKGKGLFKRGKGSSGLFFPSRLPQPGETWLLVEGVKDAAVLSGLGFNVAGLPTSELNAKYARLFTGCDVIVVPDLDVPGGAGAQKSAGRLAGVAASVRIARLPGEIVQSHGNDVRDVLSRHGADAVRAAIDAAVSWEPSANRSGDEHPEVLVTLNEAAVAVEVLKHLATLGWNTNAGSAGVSDDSRLFHRGGVLVHVVCEKQAQSSGITLPEAVPQIRGLPKALLRERITQAVRLVEEVDRGGKLVTVTKRPHEWLVRAIHQRGDFGSVPKLAGIVRTPTLRPDGTVLQDEGYDPATGLLLLPSCNFSTIPESPTRQDAQKAVAELFDVVADFPFGSDAHRSIWLACALTMLARPAIDGPCPLFVFDANTRGAGKTLLADLAGIIATGNPLARQPWPGGDEHVRKAITSIVMEGWPAVLFDNVASTLGGAAIDAALTGPIWQDRVLGESRTTGQLPLMTVWLATGNNVELSADTARRVLMTRLESPEEHPEDRADFRHVDIRKHVRAERSRLAVAGLTILRAYFAAGCPDASVSQWGSFEAWSRLIRHAMVWAGCADPWQTRETVRDADRSAELVRLIHAGIEEADNECNGVTTADIERLLSHPVSLDALDQWPTLRIAMTELGGANPQSRKIGYGLRKYRGRVCAGKRLESRPGHGGVKRWFVEMVEKPQIACGGDGGNGGDEISQFNVSDAKSTTAPAKGGHNEL